MTIHVKFFASLREQTGRAEVTVEPGVTNAEQLQIMRIVIPAPTVAEPERVVRLQNDIVDSLAAAVYVDDASLFGEFVGWLCEVLASRRVPLHTVGLTFDVMADRLREPHIAATRSQRPALVVTANVGCAMHLSAGLRAAGVTMEVIHPVVLLERQLR